MKGWNRDGASHPFGKILLFYVWFSHPVPLLMMVYYCWVPNEASLLAEDEATLLRMNRGDRLLLLAAAAAALGQTSVNQAGLFFF